VWHKNGAMPLPKAKRAPRPLDRNQLQELALRYVGRYSTTRAKLKAYLARKVRERGWDDPDGPHADAITQRFAELGYVDDAAFALSKSRALTGRGYGKRRLVEKLRAAGVDEEDGAAARQHADEEAVSAALRFAERRRIGPFAPSELNSRREMERALAAMVRAGHAFALARAIIALPPGTDVDRDHLADEIRFTSD
jgi:regulatory protein